MTLQQSYTFKFSYLVRYLAFTGMTVFYFYELYGRDEDVHLAKLPASPLLNIMLYNVFI